MLSTTLCLVALVAAAEPITSLVDDAAVDQGWMSPTALTQPAKTLTVEDHELVVVRSTFALTDQLQLTAGAFLPLFEGSSWLGSVTAKVRLVDRDRLHFSVLGGGGAASGLTFYATRELFLSGGAAVSFCGDASCRGLVSAYVLVTPSRGTLPSTGETHTFVRFVYGGSVIVPVVSHVKLVAEANLTAEVHGDAGPHTSGHKLMTLTAGARLHWRALAATAGILYGYRWPWEGANGDSRGDSFVLPALSLCGRFGSGSMVRP